jgi:hypothetical protein
VKTKLQSNRLSLRLYQQQITNKMVVSVSYHDMEEIPSADLLMVLGIRPFLSREPILLEIFNMKRTFVG